MKKKISSGEVQRSALHVNGSWKKPLSEAIMTSDSSPPAVPNNEHLCVSNEVPQGFSDLYQKLLGP
jgi:hypothetical protein